MISPISKPWTLTWASHSGQCAIAYLQDADAINRVPDLTRNKLRFMLLYGKLSLILRLCHHKKQLFILLERTKSCCALAVPPSFAYILRHKPRLQDIYDVACSSPLMGANQRISISNENQALWQFLLAASGVFFTGPSYELSTSRSLSEWTTPPLLVPS